MASAKGCHGVAFQHPSELPPAYSEHSSYPAHAAGQAIPGYHAPPSGVDEYQTLLNNPQQLSYLGTSEGLVVAGQPGNTIMHKAVQGNTIPEDYKTLACFACLCCFCPVGIVAVCKSNEVHEHLDRGDVNSARIASAGAKKYALIAIFIGTILLVLFLALRLYPA
ncbi:PREDICTED: tumor suppressor candidate 5 homolog isoform X2 [Acropora digitifera]|uniref:tumor suppressor candidate 5 homolog isoform X2 n=1 Tax=Acropora digitifera TaxID=70779 RepID=UPI00077ADEE4|nr:PREDICTED: tumor suppressor candidate 5 homolog isoform X2 [Acropora digitifera]